MKEFSQEMEIAILLLSEKRLATLYELQTVYNTEDLYDMLEILDVGNYIQDEQHKEMERQRKAQQKG